MKSITLIQLKPDNKAMIIEITAGVNLKNKLMNMGIFKGKEVTKLSHIGLRGPVVIKVARSILALGHNVALKIIVGIE